jgi:hypothetical protein
MSEMGEPVVIQEPDVNDLGGPKVEAYTAQMQKLQAGTEAAKSGGSDGAGATGGTNAGGDGAGGDSNVSGAGNARGGQDFSVDSIVEGGGGSAGGKTVAEPGENEPVVIQEPDVNDLGGPKVEAYITQMQKLQAGTEAAKSGGSDGAGATGGANAGGDSKVSGAGRVGGGQDVSVDSIVEGDGGSAGGDTDTEAGEGEPVLEDDQAPAHTFASNEELPSVATPYGPALQSTSEAAISARAGIEDGRTLYRVGTLGKSQAAEAQFWSLEHPMTPGFASRHGIPPENVSDYDFVEQGRLGGGVPFVTRTAPPVGTNLGGGIEVVVQPGGVRLNGFSYLGKKGLEP